MITIYRKLDKQNQPQIHAFSLKIGENIPDDTLWVDIQSGTSIEEQAVVAAQLGMQMPSQMEIWKNHVLNRLYMECGIAYMTAAIITKADSPYPATSAVTFILSQKCLLTLRSIAPTSFNNFALRVQRPSENFPTSERILEGLLEEIITRVAHNSEVVVETLDELSHSIFGTDFDTDTPKEKSKSASNLMKDALKTLGGCADLNSKINESLHSLHRMLCFFKQIAPMHKEDTAIDNDIDILVTDTIALSQQTAFLSDKITFQLDATLGMINVEQNLIIKIFSVVAVFFLPPTLVSSMYGMNFHNMPELSWEFGYPMAITIMTSCAVIPYLYFRRKGWL